MIEYLKNLFYSKKEYSEEQEDIGCKCKRFEDQDIVLAKEVNEAEYTEGFLKRNGYKYELKRSDYSNIYGENEERYSIYFNGASQAIRANKKDRKIRKYACLSCKTCLGWHYSFYKKNNIGIKNLDEHLEENFQVHLNKIKKEEEREKLAKEICGC